jgi:hypothetical protein
MFNAPDKKVLAYKCDYEGLRRVEVYRIDGNAVTNPSIHVSVQLGCDNTDRKDEKTIFTANNSSMTDTDVKMNWATFDTLAIEYKKGLRIFKQLHNVVYSDSTLNVFVTYKEVE